MTTTPQLWPIFICYRHVDGINAARRLHEVLDKWETTGPDGEAIKLDVYLDETMPGVEDWMELHRPYLEKARAMIVICTPGTKLNEGPEDYVHHEIDWWLKHREVAPILIDPLMEGLRFVPSQIAERYPNIQRIALVENEWRSLTETAFKEKTDAIRRQIIGTILPIGAEIYAQELKQERQRARRLRLAFTVSILLLVGAVIAGTYAFFQQSRAEEQAVLARNAVHKANYNLAKVFEEKALQALKDARDNNDVGIYKQVWLFTAAALKQEIGPDRVALDMMSASKLLAPETIKAAFAERWFSPSANFHKSSVKSLSFSPDGKTLASGSWDNTIRLWDVESGSNLGELKGHSDTVTSVSFSPDGKTLVSGSWDNTIRLWDVESGSSLVELKGHSDAVSSVSFSPDGKTLASASRDKSIRLWDVESGSSLVELKGHKYSVTSVSFSPDGKTLAAGAGAVALGLDKSIRLWDVESGRSLRELKGHTASVESVSFSPDGKTLASGSVDKTIRCWDISFYFMFWKDGKSTKLFFDFAEGVEFFWQTRREELEFKQQVKSNLYHQNGYQFKFNPKFYPLIKPPAPGQSKFDQILEWAKVQPQKGEQ